MKPQAKFRLSLQLFSDSKLAPSVRALTTATPLTILSEHVLKHAKGKIHLNGNKERNYEGTCKGYFELCLLVCCGKLILSLILTF
jgi:hypothetical protein